MDRQTVKALLESGVLQAYAEGKTIQRQGRGGVWHEVEDTFFSLPAPSYRVKPEPLHDWVVQANESGRCYLEYGQTASWMKAAYGEEKAYSYRRLVPVTEE